MKERRPKRPRGRPRTLDRQRTVALATDCYWREGPHELSVNEICRRTGVSKPGLYREFGGEDGLMAAVVEHYCSLTTVPLLALLASERPFADVLDDLVGAITHRGDGPVGCLLTALRSSPQRLGPETLARVEAVTDELRAAYAGWYARALSRGEVDPAVSPELAARFLDTQISTVLLQMGLGQDPALVRAQVELALRGLVRR